MAMIERRDRTEDVMTITTKQDERDQNGAGQKRAFTLVELLVVIGIIALLVSVLLPVLGSARRAAMNVKCMSNLRQCATALQLYVNTYKGYAIPLRCGGGAPKNNEPDQDTSLAVPYSLYDF